MSQRECAGFNWPPLSIPASEPISISPEAVSRAGPVSVTAVCRLSPPARPSDPGPVVLFVCGVGQPVSEAICGSGMPASQGRIVPLPRFASVTVVVGHPASFACDPSVGCIFAPQLPAASSFADGVSQPAKSASRTKQAQPCFVPCSAFCPNERPDVSCACGVVQPFSNPPEPLSDVRRPDARSAQINRPAGVARSFQVSVYKVEPTEAVLARNLLAKDDWRAALADEVEEGRPEVPLVSEPCAFACRAERLARATACPDRAVIGPSGAAQGVGPDANACEEVALSKPGKVSWNDILDAPLVHLARRDVPAADQFAQPRRRLGVDLVVVGAHPRTPANRPPTVAT
jgi:hypothetical protein